MDISIMVGYIAGTLTTVSFVPQVARSWRLRETKDISLLMILLFAAGDFLWMVYGIWSGSAPIIVANFVTFGLVLFLLGMKLRYH
jgi:MtN3 and saliva related transmembrane protein